MEFAQWLNYQTTAQEKDTYGTKKWDESCEQIFGVEKIYFSDFA